MKINTTMPVRTRNDLKYIDASKGIAVCYVRADQACYIKINGEWISYGEFARIAEDVKSSCIDMIDKDEEYRRQLGLVYDKEGNYISKNRINDKSDIDNKEPQIPAPAKLEPLETVYSNDVINFKGSVATVEELPKDADTIDAYLVNSVNSLYYRFGNEWVPHETMMSILYSRCVGREIENMLTAVSEPEDKIEEADILTDDDSPMEVRIEALENRVRDLENMVNKLVCK